MVTNKKKRKNVRRTSPIKLSTSKKAKQTKLAAAHDSFRHLTCVAKHNLTVQNHSEGNLTIKKIFDGLSFQASDANVSWFHNYIDNKCEELVLQCYGNFVELI